MINNTRIREDHHQGVAVFELLSYVFVGYYDRLTRESLLS